MLKLQRKNSDVMDLAVEAEPAKHAFLKKFMSPHALFKNAPKVESSNQYLD